MRLPRVWFTVRGLMIAVALVALLLTLGIEVMRRKSQTYFCTTHIYPEDRLKLDIFIPQELGPYGRCLEFDPSRPPPKIAYCGWEDPEGRRGRLVYEVTRAGLRVNGWWYGPIQAGDFIEIMPIMVRVNGRVRLPGIGSPTPLPCATLVAVGFGVIIGIRFIRRKRAQPDDPSTSLRSTIRSQPPDATAPASTATDSGATVRRQATEASAIAAAATALPSQ
jgi:hypothetical protein